MNKNIIIILVFLVSMLSVNALNPLFWSGFYGPQEFEDIEIVSDIVNSDSFQTDLLYEDIFDSYLSGNLSRNALQEIGQLSSGSFKPGEGEEQFIPLYEDLTISELKNLKKILIQNSYVDPGDDTVINEQISLRTELENKSYSKYLEYESLKNIQRNNINKVWVQIVSFTQLIIEVLNIGVYILGFFLFVFVVVDAIPYALIYMRNKILENYLQKRGIKQ